MIPTDTASDRYASLVQLGASATTVTLLGEDRVEPRRVVLRVPTVALLALPAFAERLEHEARQLQRIHHPHIVRVLDVGRRDGVPFVVTEYVEGDSLAHRLTPSPSPQSPTQVYGWLVDCAEALDFIHAKQATHRAVGPTNVLFGPDDEVRLTDFAFARAIDALERPTGVPFGNAARPHLLAPEVREGGCATARSDMFALAATVYEALTGTPLPSDAHATEPALRRHLSEEATADVLRALATDPARRFDSCFAFARAFGLERQRTPTRSAGFGAPPVIRSANPVLRTSASPSMEPGHGHTTTVLAEAHATPTLPTSPARDLERSAPPVARGASVVARVEPVGPPSARVASDGPLGRPPVGGTRAWRLSMGAPERLASRALDAGFVSPGWEELGDLTGLARAADPHAAFAELLATFGRAYGVSGMRARLGASQVWRFVRGIAPGDVILVPTAAGGVIRVGRVRGAYEFVADAPDGLGQPHRRAVDWISNVTCDELPAALADCMDGPQPLQGLEGCRDFVRAIVDEVGATGLAPAVPRPVLAHVVEALHAAEPLRFAGAMVAWAAAEGLDVEIVPGPAARLWSAIGTLAPTLPVAAPVRLWIHQDCSLLGESTVLEARGALGADELGTIVSLGAFSQDARVEAAARGKKYLRLVGGLTLAHQLLQRWDQLSAEVQTALGAVRVRHVDVSTHFESTPAG